MGALTVDEHARPDLGALRVQHNSDVRPGNQADRLTDALQGGGVRLSRAGRVGRGGRAVRRASLCAQPPAGSFAHRVVTVRKIQARDVHSGLDELHQLVDVPTRRAHRADNLFMLLWRRERGGSAR